MNSRRDFMRTSFYTIGGASLYSLGCKSSHPIGMDSKLRANLVTTGGVPIRQSIHALIADGDQNDPNGVIASYKKAISIMSSLPDDNPIGWVGQASKHNEFCPHGDQFFLPWHRHYIYCFEKCIQYFSGNEQFALPYWDWTQVDLAGHGATGVPQLFMDDDILSFRGNPPMTQRSPSGSKNLPESIAGINTIKAIMEIGTFDLFQENLEGTPHNGIHVAVGSPDGTMITMWSPLDPIFWLHHCNVDRLWAVWQQGVSGAAAQSKVDTKQWLDREFQEQFHVPRVGLPVENAIAEPASHNLTVEYALEMIGREFHSDELVAGFAESLDAAPLAAMPLPMPAARSAAPQQNLQEIVIGLTRDEIFFESKTASKMRLRLNIDEAKATEIRSVLERQTGEKVVVLNQIPNPMHDSEDVGVNWKNVKRIDLYLNGNEDSEFFVGSHAFFMGFDPEFTKKFKSKNKKMANEANMHHVHADHFSKRKFSLNKAASQWQRQRNAPIEFTLEFFSYNNSLSLDGLFEKGVDPTKYAAPFYLTIK